MSRGWFVAIVIATAFGMQMKLLISKRAPPTIVTRVQPEVRMKHVVLAPKRDRIPSSAPSQPAPKTLDYQYMSPDSETHRETDHEYDSNMDGGAQSNFENYDVDQSTPFNEEPTDFE
jgi:hypothetical protein